MPAAIHIQMATSRKTKTASRRPARTLDPTISRRLEQAGLPQALPRGHNMLPRDVVQRSQRARINEAMAGSVAAKGYAATTVADVTSLAGVSRTTFYEQFRDKEACYLACFEDQIRYLINRVRAVIATQHTPAGQFVQALAAMLDIAAAEPIYAHAFIGQATTVGPNALEALLDHKARIIRLLREIDARVPRGQRERSRLPVEIFEMAMHGMYEFLSTEIRAGRAGRLPQRLPHMCWLWFSALGLPQWAETALASTPAALRKRDWSSSAPAQAGDARKD